MINSNRRRTSDLRRGDSALHRGDPRRHLDWDASDPPCRRRPGSCGTIRWPHWGFAEQDLCQRRMVAAGSGDRLARAGSTRIGRRLRGSRAGLRGNIDARACFAIRLASPGILGVSAGGAFGAVAVPCLWLGRLFHLAATGLRFRRLADDDPVVYALASYQGDTPLATLLLAGIAVTALAGSATSFVLVMSAVTNGRSRRRSCSGASVASTPDDGNMWRWLRPPFRSRSPAACSFSEN